MRIAMVGSEVAPFSKEGGLADVLGSLPAALAGLGEDVCVISPLYRGVRERAEALGLPLRPVEKGDFVVPIGAANVPGSAWQSVLPGTDVPVYFLQNDRYYDREGYYTRREDNTDFLDNSERFIFLARGALEFAHVRGLKPDVLHSHDWPTGLVPIYVKHIYRDRFPRTGTVFTIHNIAYQGIFWHWDMNLAGLPWELFNWRMLEYYGNLSFLKAGLVGADVLTTVSRRYAEEIRTEEHGCGMHGVLQERAEDLHGIVNGIDRSEWSPATDQLIPANYTAEDLSGKAECKRALQERFGLRQEPDVPLIGMVCRLVDQKGLDLLQEALPVLLQEDVQFVVLGLGDPGYHAFLTRTQGAQERSFGVVLAHDNATAHLVEAGSDMFLMPSRFEPCGLNQLYSLQYGTVPVVRATGGLADTVVDYTEEGLRAGTATGFRFGPYEASALIGAVRRALAVYRQRDAWRRLMRNGVAADWSWSRSAREYVEVYRKACRKAGHGPAD
ncbi:MAG: glycogen synthase GlgA [Candidatus Brocadiaceae bacterium]|nr:glycogen synthase GlgA [Candidatus Brocadiaceae bacterium]